MVTFLAIIFSIIFLIYGIFQRKEKIQSQKLNKTLPEMIEECNKIEQETKKLLEEKDQITKDLIELAKVALVEKEKNNKIYEEETKKLLTSIQECQSNAENAKDSYFAALEQSYLDKENEFDNKIIVLEEKYNQRKKDIQTEINKDLKELEKVQSKRNAAIQAELKEQELKDKLSFHKLSVKEDEFEDIKVLERMKDSLKNKRILSQLIWSTFFQKEMTSLCNNLLGTSTIIGIYKITNLENNKVYIGQSVDVSKRWKNHAKCGLGIDTPAGNKLYKDMQSYGIWNFSWELLEKCSKEELNEKERFYIELYQSKEYGYNTLKGVN